MHARTNTHVLLYCFFVLFLQVPNIPYTLYTRILLSFFASYTRARTRARTHTHTLVLLSFICQRWCHNTHTLAFTLTHSELVHARSLCYELTDATEIMTHGVACLFLVGFFCFVLFLGGVSGGGDSNISTKVCRFRPLEKQRDMLYITCMPAGTN